MMNKEEIDSRLLLLILEMQHARDKEHEQAIQSDLDALYAQRRLLTADDLEVIEEG